jgi:hypothetical protein
MSVKSSLLVTLGTLALGATSVATSAEAADLFDRCEYIRTLEDVGALSQIVRQHDDACSLVALQRIVDLTQPASYQPPAFCPPGHYDMS